MGSGSTAIAAIREERNYIGIELLPEYVELARKSCEAAMQGMVLLREVGRDNTTEQANPAEAVQLRLPDANS